MSIVYELSNESQVVDQYYAMRERCFRRELEIPDFDGSEETQDLEGQILIARQHGKCIGGARISSSVPMCEEQLGNLELSIDRCCSWERLVLDPAARSVQFARDFCAQLISASGTLGYHNAVVLSSLRNARFYRQCHAALGVGFKIHHQLPDDSRGAFSGLEHYLSVSQLQRESVSWPLAA